MENHLKSLLSSEQITQLSAIEKHATTLLDHTSRFKYFTLHGKEHISNLFKIYDLLHNAGLRLTREQAFLLGCSICVHDIGMVIPLSDFNPISIFRGKPQPSDPAKLESLIRDTHHELIDNYVSQHYDFLFSIGLNPSLCSIISEISKCHRKVDLSKTSGHVRSIGALLRVIDELDIYASRAPASVLQDHYQEMDSTSCWHWLKHNICDDWMEGHNINVEKNPSPKITFLIAVHPPNRNSIPYWLHQIKRPIHNVLSVEGSSKVINDTWSFQIVIQHSQELSSEINLGSVWPKIHDKALSSGRKVILVIDDEVRKLEALFLPLMQNYHVIFSPNAKDAFDKLAAAPIDLAIVDLQVGSGFMWPPEETQDFKMTGIKIYHEIQKLYPSTKIGILSGSRYDLSSVNELNNLQFLLRKPIDPEDFEKEVDRVLSR